LCQPSPIATTATATFSTGLIFLQEKKKKTKEVKNEKAPLERLYCEQLPIIAPIAPHVCSAVDKPSKVQAEQVTQNGLRHEGHVPWLSPEVDGHDGRQNEAKQNFQRDEVPLGKKKWRVESLSRILHYIDTSELT
jgi:hypothetical protein